MSLTPFKTVPQYQRLIRFTLGRYDGAPRGPGLVWTIPFIHTTTWVDLREEVLDVEQQTCITKDNAPVAIDMLVFMRVTQAEASVIQVQSYRTAARSVAITTLRAVAGDMALDELLANRAQINSILHARLGEVTDRWGVEVSAVEIREILPPHDIQEAMSRQMSAERHRRATVTESEGTREAAVTVAYGQRAAAILNAEGTKQAAILEAEGSRQSAILEAEGYSNALGRISQVARNLEDKTMALQYLETMRVLAGGDGEKWVVPTELTLFARDLAATAQRSVSHEAAASQPE